jgi:hypothetical protein
MAYNDDKTDRGTRVIDYLLYRFKTLVKMYMCSSKCF